MRFYVNIDIEKNDEFIYYPLTVYKDSKPELVFNFYSLADAVDFTENTIAKCVETDEIVDSYQDGFTRKLYKTNTRK